MLRLRPALALAWLSLLLPASASAELVARGESVSEGPVLAGERVAWGERRIDLAPDGAAVKVAPFGGPARLAANLPASGGDRILDDLAASPSRLAFEVVQDFGKYSLGGTEGVWLGPADGPAERLEACAYDDGAYGSIDVSGESVAWIGCRPPGYPVVPGPVLVDAPGESRRKLSDTGANVRIAGRYVAWLERGQLHVYDLARDREAYRVEDARIRDFDVQEDGKVATLVSDDERVNVAWFSAEEPRPHVVAAVAEPSVPPTLRIAADSIAVLGQTADERDQTSELTLIDLQGNARTVARVPSPEGFDFDGTRVAFGVNGCHTTDFHVRAVDAPALVQAAPHGCFTRIPAPPRVSSRGLVSFALECSGYSGDACLRPSRASVVGPGGRSLGSAEVVDDLAQYVSVRLSARGRALLRRPGGVRVTLRVVPTRRDGRRIPGDRHAARRVARLRLSR